MTKPGSALKIVNYLLLAVIILVILGLVKVTYQTYIFIKEAEERGGNVGSWIGILHVIMIPVIIVWIILFFAGKAAEKSDKIWVTNLSTILNIILGIIPGLVLIYALYIKNN